MSLKKTTKEFIKEAKEIHGGKYDYSLVNYKTAITKIKIICLKHGTFEQIPNSHLNGSGCPKCSHKGIKYTTEEFIIKAKEIHGGKYDYSLVDYIDNKTKIKITCPKHGVFKKRPNLHLSKKQGCPKCMGRNRTTEEFIIKAKEIHGGKYDYSLVDYIDSTTKIKIICPKHGVFEQTPGNHFLGKECYNCGKFKIKYTTEEFIIKAKEIHGGKYDYSLVDYIGSTTKIKIICPKHGIFKQKASSHLNGNGCPTCNSSKGEIEIINYLNYKNINYEREYKFDDCKDKRVLPFDFYIKDLNILIEFDGDQHRKAIKFFGGEKMFKDRQRKDVIKTKYAKDNNIQLIRINCVKDIKTLLTSME